MTVIQIVGSVRSERWVLNFQKSVVPDGCFDAGGRIPTKNIANARKC
jgi:hypothetical protein